MAENSYFFNSSVSNKRTYRAEDFARYFESVLSSGILPNFDGIRGATDGEYGLNVSNYVGTLRVGVKAGHAIIKGHRYELSGEERLTIRTTSGVTANRIDRIVLRLDKRASARHIKLFVKEGAEAYNAQPPELTRTADVHEISLAQVHVRGGQSYIDDITDERLDESVCGVANSLINVPTSQFVEQFNTWFGEYTGEAQNEFDTWFNSVKGVIDDSLANRLLLAIQALATEKADKTEVNALATEKADKTEVNQQMQQRVTHNELAAYTQGVIDWSPSEVYATYDALVTAYPNGKSGMFLVQDEGHVYSWIDDAWVDLGVYQAAGIADKSVTHEKLAFNALEGKKSRNLFNKEDVILNTYINYQSGILVQPAENYAASRFIDVKPSTTYRIDGTKEQFAMYDADGNYISGLPDNATMPFTTPSNARRLRLTAKISELDNVQLIESDVMLPYIPFGSVLDSERIQEPIPAEKLDERLLVAVPSKNLFDKTLTIADRYINYTTGQLVYGVNYGAVRYIPINPSTYYYLSGTREQLAFYDQNRQYISGLPDNTIMPFLTPPNAYFVGLSARLNELDKVQLEESEVKTKYSAFGKKVPQDAIDYLDIPTTNKHDDAVKKIVVRKDGGGDFTTLVDAIKSITDASIDKRYEIYLHEGIYDVVAEMVDDETYLNGRGLFIPSYVDIIGEGRRHMIVVKGELPDGASNERIQRVSTLDYKGKVGLYNLTITARNMRYPVHPDYGNVYNDIIIENCDLIHYGNRDGAWIYCHAFASGIGDGGVAIMRNSRFITYGTSEHTRAWSIHNSNGQTKACYVEIDNCECINIHGNVAIHFGSLLTGTADKAIVKNTYIKGVIENVEEISGKKTGNEDFTVEAFNIATEKTIL